MNSSLRCIWCLLFGLGILTAALPAAAAPLESQEGIHPYDVRDRVTVRGSARWERDHTDYRALYDFYYNSPHRSVTHALHPLNRYRYWSSNPSAYVTVPRFGARIEALLFEYDRSEGMWVQAFPKGLAISSGACDNYVYTQPNQRTPAFGYRCVDGKEIAR